MALEIVYSTWESSVQKLPKYLGAIQKYNQELLLDGNTNFQRQLVLMCWDMSSRLSNRVDGFQFCRMIINVDDTHLYTKYKHKLLIAAAMGGNQQVLPLAFAIVDEEIYPSWKWFLQQLSRHVIRGRRGMCLISDRHDGLIKAVREGSCWQVGSEYQLRKFNRIMEEIKKQHVKAFAYLDQINKEKWTASHDGGWRCGILTTNMSECINGVLKGDRRLPSLQQSVSVVTRRQNGHGMNTHVIKIANRKCSCSKKYAVHTILVCINVKDYYDLMAYNNTYSKHFEPVQSEDYGDDPNF
ncbi:UNVERIFIED_CONTAM: hypothetical protein Sangu_1733900 [Sesamum angustifolium]|uniref:MULE transposase domain-containing protein n=1 Tax=Sesamum angustifolium TaxID=2727405 RepID=A0AAW2M6P1_9LAMI